MRALPTWPGTRQLLAPALVTGLVPVMVWVTVGGWAALGALLLLTGHWVAGPDRKVVASATVALFVALPFVWLSGSGLPLSPPAPRLQDNTTAHQLGGLAIWMLCVAVWLDISRVGARRDGLEDSGTDSFTLGHDAEPQTRKIRP